jgi:hypothetical protein
MNSGNPIQSKISEKISKINKWDFREKKRLKIFAWENF